MGDCELSVEDLKQSYNNADKQYLTLKRQCEDQVVRWEWADFTRYSIEPFYFERNCFHRGNLLSEEPAVKRSEHHYGFDKQDRIVVERQYAGERHHYESFTTFHQHYIDTIEYTYSPDKKPLNMTRQHIQNGVVQKMELVTDRNWSVETYRYRAGQLIEIVIDNYQDYNKTTTHRIERLSYDADENLMRIESEHEGQPWLLYQRPEAWQTLEAMATIIEDKLVAIIPLAVKDAAVKERVFCLSITCSPQPGALPIPVVCLGPERLRQEWLRGETYPEWEFVWSPGHQNLLSDALKKVVSENKAYQELGRLFDQEIFLNDRWEIMEGTLINVARRLKDLDWATLLDTTEDFVVYYVDEEMNHLSQCLKAVVPATLLESLRAKGLYKEPAG